MYPSETSFPRPDFEAAIRDHLAWLERMADEANRVRSLTRRNAYRAAAADLRGRLA